MKEDNHHRVYENVARRGPREPAEHQFAQQVPEHQPPQYQQLGAVNFGEHEPARPIQQQVGNRAEKLDIQWSDTDTIVTMDPRTLNYPCEEHFVDTEEVYLHRYEYNERAEARDC